ncbi:MAG: molybdenum cofactor biosynthesis protein MoaE [Candidatus Bathyarchaeia archaeon]|nr:molybdenum cofactor biosynthesis protein MoaE [Candidatus Bathyarchaeota archaeon]
MSNFLVSKRGISLKKLMNFIKECEDGEDGAIGIFLGIVRGETYQKERVAYLEFDAYKEKAEEAFKKIAEEIKEQYKITNVLIHHVMGQVKVGEKIMMIAVSGKSRKDVFPALREIVERVKQEAPLWKKETLEDGRSYWIEYKP